MRAALLILPLALLGAAEPRDAAGSDQARLARTLAGLTPGRSMSCLPFANMTLNTQAIGPVLLYKRGNGDVYLNRTTGGCEGAANGDVLVQVEYQGRSCSGDTIRTVDAASRTTTGSCALRDFVPYTRPRR